MLRKLFCLGPPSTTDAPSTSERVRSTTPQPEVRPDQSPLGALRSMLSPSPLSTPRRGANARRAALPRDNTPVASNPEQQVETLRAQGMDMAELARSIDRYFLTSAPLPEHIQFMLEMAGVPRDTTHATHGITGSRPLVLLQRALLHEPDVQVQNLRIRGVDMADLVRAIRQHRRRGAPIPDELAASLRRVGIDVDHPDRVAQSGGGTPLERLTQALRRDPHTQVAILMAQGHDPSALQHTIGLHFGTNAEFPQALARDFQAAGVRIGPTGGINRHNDPLVRLQGVLIGMSRQHAAASPRPTASPLPPWAMARSPRTHASTSASGSTPGRGWAASIPEREDEQSNLQYAMAVHQARPRMTASELAALSGADVGEVEVAIDAVSARRRAEIAGGIYDNLQPIDLHFANTKHGFVDRETHCMFGGTLSLDNSNQRVVAVSAQRLSDGVPESLAFMDLNKLAGYVHDSGKHPLTNARLGEGLAAVAALKDFTLRITK